jgi:hypothetical protein
MAIPYLTPSVFKNATCVYIQCGYVVNDCICLVRAPEGEWNFGECDNRTARATGVIVKSLKALIIRVVDGVFKALVILGLLGITIGLYIVLYTDVWIPSL